MIVGFVNFMIPILILLIRNFKTCGYIILHILVVIAHFIIFYKLLDHVNSASLLLFWTDFWCLICGIYYIIEFSKELISFNGELSNSDGQFNFKVSTNI
ncbi:hypothetical protein C2G38_2084143, partial [Gigaspora rosea]